MRLRRSGDLPNTSRTNGSRSAPTRARCGGERGGSGDASSSIDTTREAHFGLANDASVDVHIRWPATGIEEDLADVSADQVLVVPEG